MNRWKCSVCHNIMESEEAPTKCSYCDAASHKIKAKFKLLRRRFEFMD